MGNTSPTPMLPDAEVAAIVKETGFSHDQIVRLYTRFRTLDRKKRGYLDRNAFQRIPELAKNPLGPRIVETFFTQPNGAETGTTAPAMTAPAMTAPAMTAPAMTAPGVMEAGTTGPDTMEPGMTEDGTTGTGTTEPGTMETGTTETGTAEPDMMEADTMGPVKTEAETMGPIMIEAIPGMMEAGTLGPVMTTVDRIDFRQFVKVLTHFRPQSKSKPNKQNSKEEKLKFLFSMYDENRDGFITNGEFKAILSKMVGANITPDQLDSITERIVSEADADKDGKISFDDFCKLWRRHIMAMERTDVNQKMSIRF